MKISFYSEDKRYKHTRQWQHSGWCDTKITSGQISTYRHDAIGAHLFIFYLPPSIMRLP